MTNGLPQIDGPANLSSDMGRGNSVAVGIPFYRTEYELTFYLRALQRFRAGRLVVVLGLQNRKFVFLTDLPSHVRVILTAIENDVELDAFVGFFVPDPQKAVAVAMAGLRRNDGLMLLFPTDWRGDPPSTLIEKARRQPPLSNVEVKLCNE